MLIDLTYPLESNMIDRLFEEGKGEINKMGHFGTHFDVCNQVFPLEYCKREGILFDVRNVQNREIKETDLDMKKIKPGQAVLFFTGMMQIASYGTEPYKKRHPELSVSLIQELAQMKISLIGLDMAGIRRDPEHPKYDLYLAELGVFVIENLINLDVLHAKSKPFTLHTYPVNYIGYTGLPARVIAEVD